MKAKKPNILVFMTDHQRYDTVFPYKRAKTPHSDAFMKNGAAFVNAYCVAPHCCPSRASFFTGEYPSIHGLWNNFYGGSRMSDGFDPKLKLFTEYLKDDGYATYFSGKWHISQRVTPEMRGFDKVFPPHNPNDLRTAQDLTKALWEQYRTVKAAPRGRKKGELPREGYPDFTLYGCRDNAFGDDGTVDSALVYLDDASAQDKPWFMFCGIGAPHDPYLVPQKYLDMYPADSIELPQNYYDDFSDKPNLYKRVRQRFSQLTESEVKEAIRHYLAFCSYCDAKFGQLLQKLRDNGQYEDTVVVYMSDHGDYAGEHGMFTKGLPCFDGAYHIPCLIGGGRIKAGGKVFKDLVSITDLAPTILDFAQVKNPYKGISLKSVIEGKKQAAHEYLYTQTNGNELYGMQRSVFNKKHKLVFNGFDFDELYDLSDDPGETKNRINDPAYAAIKRVLYKKLWRFAYENNDSVVTNYIIVNLAQYGPAIAFEEKS